MKRVLFMTVAVAVVFLGCEAGVITLDDDTEIADILRDAEFDYSNVVPVELSVEVDLSDTNLGAAAGTGLAVIQVVDSQDGLLFSASAADGETVMGEMLVPATPGEVTLSIIAPGHEPYEVVITDPYKYQQLARLISLVADPTAEPEPDTDGDGIIDAYDSAPDDPDIAFVRHIPASTPLTIAFEDNYPELGDGDYNDFVASYQIVEYRSARNNLVKVRGHAEALARGAGYDHEFGIVVRFEGMNGSGTIFRYDHERQFIERVSISGDGYVRVPLFESTKNNAFHRSGGTVRFDNVEPDAAPSEGYSSRFTIVYEAEADSTPASRYVWAPYDPYLLVRNPKHGLALDVHLIGKEPLPGSENHLLEGDVPPGFRDADGYPRALLVPGDWGWPRESTDGSPKIETAYPQFADWTLSLGASHSDWYSFAVDGEVMTR
jgi:LruC domain-containing protein